MKRLLLIIIIVSICFVLLPLSTVQSNRFDETVLNSSFLNLFIFVLGSILIYRIRFLPQVQSFGFILPISITCITINLLIILIYRFEYSIKVTLVGCLLLPVCLLAIEILFQKSGSRNLCFIQSKKIKLPKKKQNFVFIKLSKPILPDLHINGLVVDFRNTILSVAWKRLLVLSVFKNIPVYSYEQINESLSGKVNLNLLDESNITSLQISFVISIIKRAVDLVFVLTTLPIILPVSILISIAIFFDSPGGVFFKQRRVGLNGIYFDMIKFRTMFSKDNKSETKQGDQRVTKVGAFLRKYRLDEIPQFLNVFLGDMSLIGPRPETVDLVLKYEKQIPFFMYRHVVKPGISGWAQVMLGYTVGADEKINKLAYDLYYVKHYSIWLDLLIWFKTIKTVFKGSGAR